MYYKCDYIILLQFIILKLQVLVTENKNWMNIQYYYYYFIFLLGTIWFTIFPIFVLKLELKSRIKQICAYKLSIFLNFLPLVLRVQNIINHR